MLKAVLCIAVIVSSALISGEQLRCIRRKNEISRELADVIDKMEAMLRFQSADVYQLCSSCFCDCHSFDSSGFTAISDNFSRMWEKECGRNLSQADKRVFSLFEGISEYLGAFDLETQISRLEYAKNEIRYIYANSQAELLKKQKLYYSVGIFFGVLVCMIII
ncbi:MAG TPA: stage III sporulation protein AB [Candidatus Faeciplasma pullistercoris]|uniref:Stage III sporulation protein AB n=1 Tax=Candidatus Faeciplasma pullistercoris TaxID=2840800 RepID=A0A9D1KLV4_9FIRM|nr:stage III sporulation protein AB [Candidatus Faeciplasma pullistercoris]